MRALNSAGSSRSRITCGRQQQGACALQQVRSRRSGEMSEDGDNASAVSPCHAYAFLRPCSPCAYQTHLGMTNSNYSACKLLTSNLASAQRWRPHLRVDQPAAGLQGVQRLRHPLPGHKVLVVPRQRLIVICRQSTPALQVAPCIDAALFGSDMRSVQSCGVTARPAQRLLPGRF
jgi:hypothetical protein